MPQGPIIVFDKSSLVGLNPDEAVLLDNFYMSNITPLFFVELYLRPIRARIPSANPPRQLRSLCPPTNSW
jgi:hypothetical protein